MAQITEIKTRILLRNDTAARFAEVNPVLGKGEIGIENDTNKFKFGDGVKTWNELKYVGTKVEVEGEGDVVVGASTDASGTLILTKGNLNLENVYLTEGFTFTKPVGTVTIPTSGSTTYGSKDQSLKNFFSGLFAQAVDPKVTQPSVSVTLNEAKAYEAGTKITPSYKTSLNSGSYQYGPATEVETISYSVTNGTVTKNTNTGSFDEIQVTDGMNYRITSTITHSAAKNAPKNNIGTAVPTLTIAAGTKSATSASITSYRNTFYGSVTNKEGQPDNSVIRGLKHSDKTLAAGAKFNCPEAEGAMRVIIAVPAPLKCTTILDVNGLNADATSAFKLITVNVEGANGYEPKAYNVYYKDNAAACDKANNWAVTLG